MLININLNYMKAVLLILQEKMINISNTMKCVGTKEGNQ